MGLHPLYDHPTTSTRATLGFRQVFAICAMRSIYTLVSHAISDLPYLKPAVALVLGFVGGKMFAEFFHYEISVGASLAVVSARAAAGVTRCSPVAQSLCKHQIWNFGEKR